MSKTRTNIKNISLSAMFLALGLVLPLLTGQIPQIGNMLLPMHIPVLLCGLICGWQYGLTVGFITPLLRSFIFGMPLLYPSAIAMAFELATYGAVIGFLYAHSRWHCVVALYRCLIISMLAGRAVWGAAEVVLLGIKGNAFTFTAFISGAFLTAIPGIILQLVLIPAIMIALDKTGLVLFSNHKKEAKSTNE
ncbi:MAG: ECF transporter S component [Ruminococcus sp.]|nr:ECF transporter S component [Ruminococcus sp.]